MIRVTIPVKSADEPSYDAFGRLRVSEPGYRFDGQLSYPAQTDNWRSAWTPGTGTVTYDAVNRSMNCQVFTYGTAVFQSHYHAPYTPGRSQTVFMSFIYGTTPGPGATRKAGYWDGQNGCYLEQDSTGLYLVLTSTTSAGIVRVPQSLWNADRMDGTGPNRFALDMTKTQILSITLQALYSGQLTIGFDIDGVVWPAHRFNNANNTSAPYLAQASLPVRYEVSSTGTGCALRPICATVVSEGGEELTHIAGRTFAASNGATPIGVTTRRPILSIRAQQFMNGIRNNVLLLPQSLSCRVTTQDAYIELVRNGSLTGASWTQVDGVNSSAEYDVAASAISGGTTLFSSFAIVNAAQPIFVSENVLSKLVLTYSHLLSQADTLSVVATSMNATSNLSATLNWKEIR